MACWKTSGMWAPLGLGDASHDTLRAAHVPGLSRRATAGCPCPSRSTRANQADPCPPLATGAKPGGNDRLASPFLSTPGGVGDHRRTQPARHRELPAGADQSVTDSPDLLAQPCSATSRATLLTRHAVPPRSTCTASPAAAQRPSRQGVRAQRGVDAPPLGHGAAATVCAQVRSPLLAPAGGDWRSPGEGAPQYAARDTPTTAYGPASGAPTPSGLAPSSTANSCRVAWPGSG